MVGRGTPEFDHAHRRALLRHSVHRLSAINEKNGHRDSAAVYNKKDAKLSLILLEGSSHVWVYIKICKPVKEKKILQNVEI